MAISTGLSVPVFNVLKYIFIIILIETIARGALNNVHVFLRKLDLYEGRGSPLSRSRIDRYNLFQIRGKRPFIRIAFWTLLVTCFYVVEVLFEFSSDAVRQVTVRPEQKMVYNASYDACEPFHVLRSFVASGMNVMALACVEVTDNEYILYKPLWIQEASSTGETPFCVHVPQNVLRRGKRIYEDRRFRPGTPSWDAVSDLISAIKKDSWIQNQNGDSILNVISVSSSDVLISDNLVPGSDLLQASFLVVHIPSRPNSYCGGFLVGALGEGVMTLVMSACIDESITGTHYVQAFGTTTVFLDADRVQKEHWTVDVVVNFGVAIRNFTKGVISADEKNRFLKVLAYTGFLSVASERDSVSLNKFAAFYRHCNLIKIAQPWDKVQQREVKNAVAEEKITVSLSEWGLSLVICWSLILLVVAKCLLSIAQRKGMPKAVDGELNLARRWAAAETTNRDQENTTSSKNDTTSIKDDTRSKRWHMKFFDSLTKQVYLNVENELEYDDIVAGHTPVEIIRDSSKPFKEISSSMIV